MDPLTEPGRGDSALEYVLAQTLDYLDRLPDLDAHATSPSCAQVLDLPFPETGIGSLASTRALWDLCDRHAANTAGPRFFDFVIGGVMPAALAADWVTSVFDQNAAGRITGGLPTNVEILVLRWLRSLLGLPSTGHGVLVPSATYANFAGLACARQWLGEKHGVDVTSDGTHGLPPITVVGSAYTHPSVEKALQMLGMGRKSLTRVDLSDSAPGLARMRAILATAGPSILIASAGDVNGGDFDPITDIAAIADEYGAWLHVDAAFGLIAAFEPTLAGLLRGVDRADSIAADGHKWLNLPYDSGIALIRDRGVANRAFAVPGAPYLADLAGPDPGFASLGPDASRRARAFPAFAAILAYGRAGIAEMIERQARAASALAAAVEGAHGFRVLAGPVLPIVSFRAEPPGVADLDAFNIAVAEKVNAAGRFAIGTTTVSGVRAMRAALLNWGVTERIAEDLFTEVAAAASDLLRRDRSR